jgi:hypothetical protein
MRHVAMGGLPANDHGEVIADRARGIVRADLRCHRVHIKGSYPNVDVVV